MLNSTNSIKLTQHDTNSTRICMGATLSRQFAGVHPSAYNLCQHEDDSTLIIPQRPARPQDGVLRHHIDCDEVEIASSLETTGNGGENAMAADVEPAVCNHIMQYANMPAGASIRTSATGAVCSSSPRPRWCPTPEQIQVLEALFNSGTTTPSRDMIVEIAACLKQFGGIVEANVFYWFQNRKARAKRKLRMQHAAAAAAGMVQQRATPPGAPLAAASGATSRSANAALPTEYRGAGDHVYAYYDSISNPTLNTSQRSTAAITMPDNSMNDGGACKMIGNNSTITMDGGTIYDNNCNSKYCTATINNINDDDGGGGGCAIASNDGGNDNDNITGNNNCRFYNDHALRHYCNIDDIKYMNVRNISSCINMQSPSSICPSSLSSSSSSPSSSSSSSSAPPPLSASSSSCCSSSCTTSSANSSSATSSSSSSLVFNYNTSTAPSTRSDHHYSIINASYMRNHHAYSNDNNIENNCIHNKHIINNMNNCMYNHFIYNSDININKDSNFDNANIICSQANNQANTNDQQSMHVHIDHEQQALVANYVQNHNDVIPIISSPAVTNQHHPMGSYISNGFDVIQGATNYASNTAIQHPTLTSTTSSTQSSGPMISDNIHVNVHVPTSWSLDNGAVPYSVSGSATLVASPSYNLMMMMMCARSCSTWSKCEPTVVATNSSTTTKLPCASSTSCSSSTTSPSARAAANGNMNAVAAGHAFDPAPTLPILATPAPLTLSHNYNQYYSTSAAASTPQLSPGRDDRFLDPSAQDVHLPLWEAITPYTIDNV